jgi:hypothetical protein
MSFYCLLSFYFYVFVLFLFFGPHCNWTCAGDDVIINCQVHRRASVEEGSYFPRRRRNPMGVCQSLPRTQTGSYYGIPTHHHIIVFVRVTMICLLVW